MTGTLLVLWHLGELHAYEKVLVLLVAFGPFLVLSLVLRHAQRRNAAEDEQGEDLSGRPPTT